jgi:hypothetical protein
MYLQQCVFLFNTSIALQNGSQQLAEVLEPKTILVARKYIFSTIKPKARVTSACICEKQKHAVMSARASIFCYSGG